MSLERSQFVMRWIMAIFYAIAGIVHLRSPDAFLPIVPHWVPLPQAVILCTGICEIAGAVALVTRPLRWWAGVMLALYAVCVFPANIKHALENVPIAGLQVDWWYHAPRLAFQPVLVWWALFCSGVTNWPMKQISPMSHK
jgi:uncharacterized membrane protein